MSIPIKVQYKTNQSDWSTIKETDSASAAAYTVDALFDFNQQINGVFSFRAFDENHPPEEYIVRDNITGGNWFIIKE